MRIAIAYDCLYPWTLGGGERQYRAFAEELAARGHTVTYLTRRQWDGAAPDLDGVRVRAVAGRAELYDDAGARRLGPALGYALALLTHLLRARHRYDVVLVSALPATNVPAARLALALTLSRALLVTDWLEVWPRERWRAYSGPVVGRLAWWVQRLAAGLSPVATCHSALSARRLVASGLRSTPVVSPGLVFPKDPGDRGAPRLGVPEEAGAVPQVVYVGRHIPDKHVEALPAALAHARTRLPDLTAAIYGDGPSRPAVLREIERSGLSAAVSAPGFVAREVLDAAVRAAAVLVNPSAREGYGLVVDEANAVGTPVVLVDGPDNAAVERVTEGVNGLVAASTDPVVLGEAIVRAVEGGADLRRSAHERYTEAARTGSIAATVDRILAVATGLGAPR
ncbi:glycosyltransferase family 4 protein [Pimelobacter sp. 30-1]|uniref:glycosyltransferase family 4 protein n=1 Tax=Pimelobacter sp. 30-1 TaxID=2004991 RepID=UPI001C05B349|nr:glycosyltransferase [Pimelobacter sp. 30-1]